MVENERARGSSPRYFPITPPGALLTTTQPNALDYYDYYNYYGPVRSLPLLLAVWINLVLLSWFNDLKQSQDGQK